MLYSKAGDSDTICAISTPPGVGGIAVLRVSGDAAAIVARKLCTYLPENLESHRLYFGVCGDLRGEAIDEVLVSFFARGRSFTGEETIEISCHGGQIMAAAILRNLVLAGARLSKPGEFTYRAFMNGRMDLVQAEAVLSLIESQSQQAGRAALRQLQGHLSAEYAKVEDDLLWILAQLEAAIDFSTEDIEVISDHKLLSRLEGLNAQIELLLGTYRQGRLLREGLQIALIGKPNAGKSSLLNALLKQERAIVSSSPGTTRDTVEGRVSFGGLPVLLVDTAGLRETREETERLGIERSRRAMRGADYVFCVVDLSSSDWLGDALNLKAESSAPSIFVFNKTDLVGDELNNLKAQFAENLALANSSAFWVSARGGSGVDEIERFMAQVADQVSDSASLVVSQARHVELLEKVRIGCAAAGKLIRENASQEFIAFELQDAVRAVHELLGKEFHEQVIDRVFREFCLGK